MIITVAEVILFAITHFRMVTIHSSTSTGRNRLFIALAATLAVCSTALTLNLIQGYTPFSPTTLSLSNTSALYFLVKYKDCQQMIFLVITTALIISELASVVAFLLSLGSLKNIACIKSSWLVYNQFTVLFIIVAVGILGLGIASGWQTAILLEILLPNNSTSPINFASIVFAHMGLACFNVDLVLIVLCGRIKR